MKTHAPDRGAAALVVALLALGGLAALSATCSPAHRATPAPAAVAAQPPAAEPERGAAPIEPTAAASVAQPAAEPEQAHEASSPAPAPMAAHLASVDFQSEILPILEARCQPCHFPGGKMYDRLPFDRPETLYLLGTKLFTRIRDADEQALLRDFLEQGADG